MTEENVMSESTIWVQAQQPHPDLLNIGNGKLKTVFLKMIFKKYLTHAVCTVQKKQNKTNFCIHKELREKINRN